MYRFVGIIEVGHRDTVGGLVHKVPHRLDEERELIIFGHCGGPHNPVALGVGVAAVEWQTILILLGEVECYLGLCHLVVEDVEVEHLVPYHIILLTPRGLTFACVALCGCEGALLLEGEAVVAILACELLPLLCHLASAGGVVLCLLVLACQLGHTAKGGNTGAKETEDLRIAGVFSNQGFYIGKTKKLNRPVFVRPELAAKALDNIVTAFESLSVMFAGQTGKGKSFLMNLLAFWIVMSGGRAFIIDPKGGATRS